MRRRIACAMLSAAVALASSARAQNRDIGQVFRDFEAICFSYAESGYTVDLTLLIEDVGFKFVQKTKDGTEVYYSDAVQLLIGEHSCAFGMAQLPYGQMLEWTKSWVEMKGLMAGANSKTPKGRQYWQWAGMGFNVGLQDDQLPDGTPLTGLVLVRK